MAVVVFDPVAFKEEYSKFATVPNGVLQNCFNTSGLYLSNTDASPVQDLDRRQQLLWLLTAHIAILLGALNPDRPDIVGRVTNGTEGSVSVGFDFPVNPGQAWYAQTQYGAMFWQATLSLRSFNYRPRPTRW